jgi:hypothetical protein
MHTHFKLILAVAAATLASIAGAQTNTDNTGRTVGEATRDSANAVGRAASAAVTPGDQNMGRTPDNRSGGLMGNERNTTDRNATDRNTGSMSDNTGTVRRAPRADRG